MTLINTFPGPVCRCINYRPGYCCRKDPAFLINLDKTEPMSQQNVTTITVPIDQYQKMADEISRLSSLLEEKDRQIKYLIKTRGEQMYPCADCGVMRTADEGGTTFTVCDDCWKKHFPPKPAQQGNQE